MHPPLYYLIEPHRTSVWVGQTVVSIVWAKLALEVTSLHKDGRLEELCTGPCHVMSLSAAHIISTFVIGLESFTQL